MSEIAHPHDRLFRRSMQEKAIAIDLLRSTLPAELLAQMDLSTLILANGDFVTKELKRFQNDCIYRCKIHNSDGYVVLAAEHQSRDEKLMAFRLLEYRVAIMRGHLSQGHDKLPIVVSLVLYHGKQSPYPHSVQLWDCFAEPELAKQWGMTPFHLIDLTTLTDEEIAQHGLAFAMEMILKHSREKRVITWLQRMLADEKLAIICSKVGANYLYDIGTYILYACGSKQQPEELEQAIALLADAIPEKREEVMTFAQQLEQRGIQQGIQQGMQQGMQQRNLEVAKNLFSAGVDVKVIKQSTGLSDEELSCLH